MLLGLSALYVTLTLSRGPRSAFSLGWAFGFGYFGLSLSWIGNALLVKGNDYAWAWPLAVVALPAALALFPALGSAAFRFAGRSTKISSVLVFVILIGGTEILRGFLFTGFPWNLFGYSWAGMPEILQSVALINVYGLTLLTLLWGALPGFWLLRLAQGRFGFRDSAFTLLVISSFFLLFLFGQYRLQNTTVENHKHITLRLVQPNIAQNEKWDRSAMQTHFETLNHLSRARGDERKTTYIIWPETAINPYIMSKTENKALLQETLSTYRGQAWLLAGTLRFEPKTGGYFNSLLLFNQAAENVQTYDKSHLVPFGEYIPFKEFIPLKTVTKFEGFQSGPGPMHQETPYGLSYSPLICYEIIFPGRVTKNNAPPPDFIVNVTNDAWYGDSAGPYQHLTKAVFRAVEEGIPVVRVANTGISAVIDPLGQIHGQIELFRKDTMTNLLPQKNVYKIRLRDLAKNIL